MQILATCRPLLAVMRTPGQIPPCHPLHNGYLQDIVAVEGVLYVL